MKIQICHWTSKYWWKKKYKDEDFLSNVLRIAKRNLGIGEKIPWANQTEGFCSVADPGCLSQIPDLNFFHPGSEFFHPGLRILIKDFKYFNPKKWFQSSRKSGPGCSSRIRILTFYPSRIPDPGVKMAPYPGSGSATMDFFSLWIHSRGPFFLLQSIFTKNIFSLLAWGVGRGGGIVCTRDRSTSQQQKTSGKLKQHCPIRSYQTQQMQSVLSRSSQSAHSTGREKGAHQMLKMREAFLCEPFEALLRRMQC